MNIANNPMEETLKAAHAQCATQIQEALKLLNGAIHTLNSAQPTSTTYPSSTGNQQSTAQAPVTSSQPNADHSSPIMSALRSSMSNAHQAIKTAEEGVKNAMAAAEQHVQSTMQSLIDHSDSNPPQTPKS